MQEHRGQIKANGKTVDFTVIQDGRKRVTVKVLLTGEVVVCLPYTCPKDYAWEVVRKSLDWIVITREHVLSNTHETHNLLEDGQILFKGETYPVEIICSDEKEQVLAESSSIRVFTGEDSPNHIRELLAEFYYEQCKLYLEERLPIFSGLLAVEHGLITVKEVKSIWGSCSPKDNITFCWRLILAPPAIFDYVIVHELCHIRHKNHSKDYWNEVASILPDCKASRNWLKANSATLSRPL